MLASPDRGGGRATCTECDALISAVPSSRGRAQWTVRFLKGGAVVDAISFALSLWVVLAPGENFVRDLAGGFSGLTVLVAYFGAATLFLRWQHLVMRQLIQRGRGFKVTPGWAVGYWFIPLANLFKPYQVIRATLTALGGEAAVRRTRLGLWWAAWLVSSVLSQVESQLALSNGLTAEPPPSSYVVGMFASLAGVVAALLCARVVSTVQACLDQPEPSQPVAAAGDPRPGRFTGPRTQTLSRT